MAKKNKQRMVIDIVDGQASVKVNGHSLPGTYPIALVTQKKKPHYTAGEVVGDYHTMTIELSGLYHPRMKPEDYIDPALVAEGHKK